MPIVRRKVLAYITHDNHLLVFRHEDPEAGIQVPGGTVEDGEDPVAAVLREAREETGLDDLTVGELLGETLQEFPEAGSGSTIRYHRRFYHLRCGREPPPSWRHLERFPSDGSEGPIPFDFFWADLADGVPELIADMGHFVPRLTAVLSLETRH